MNNTEEIFEAAKVHLKKRADLANGLWGLIRFNREDYQHVLIVCLHARTIHLARGCHAVADARTASCMSTILRSMWEADIDTVNAISDPDYCKNIYAKFLHEKLQLGKAAEPSKQNLYLAHISKTLDLPSILKSTDAEHKQLKNEGRGELSTFDRAKKANREKEYESTYNILCQDTHNGFNSLENDYVKASDDGSISISLDGKESLIVDATKTLLFATGLIAASIDKVHGFLKTSDKRASGVSDAWAQDCNQLLQASDAFRPLLDQPVNVQDQQ